MMFCRTAGEIILKLAYGYEVQGEHDPYVELVGEVMDQFGEAFRPGAYLVDMLPFLRYLPSWFPGTGFKRTAVQWRETLEQMVDVPFNMVKQRVVCRLTSVTQPPHELPSRRANLRVLRTSHPTCLKRRNSLETKSTLLSGQRHHCTQASSTMVVSKLTSTDMSRCLPGGADTVSISPSFRLLDTIYELNLLDGVRDILVLPRHDSSSGGSEARAERD